MDATEEAMESIQNEIEQQERDEREDYEETMSDAET